MAAVVVVGCGGDETAEKGDDDATGAVSGVYIVNEGNFGKGNASLSFYDSSTGTVTPDVYKPANGKPLGDTANDVVVRGGKVWVVVNNSQVIEVLDASTNKSVGQIAFPDGGSPYSLTIDDAGTYGYVPLLWGNALARVNLVSMSVDKVVEVGGNPTDCAIANGKVYVNNSGTEETYGAGTQVAVVDSTMTVKKLVPVGDRPTAVVAVGNKVVVLCSGFYDNYDTPDTNESTPGSIVVIDASSDTVSDQIPLDGAVGDRMELGPDGHAYFFVNNKVAAFDPTTGRIHTTTIQAPQGVFGWYGLGVDPVDGAIYVTDAKDFTNPGDVYVFEPNGTQRAKFTADIIPRSFGFKR
jgi:hypothetical protein